ncbi:MAG: Holliday junction resolvase RuvX [Candidatus Aureabacteria bacterium]|nr:Holliday junction resolvase RuvX [Candidatus Auribacterota bacterium]
MRVLALDVGERRIGMAMSDPLGITAQRAGTIERGALEETLRRLQEIVIRDEIGTVVVGLPLSMDGSRGTSAAGMGRFAEDLRRALAIPVTLWDERLTTAEADRLMRSAGVSRKERMRHLDEVAAQLILQSYMDSRREGSEREHC